MTIVLRVLLSAGLPLAVGGCHPSTSRDMTTSDPQPPPSHSAWIEARETALAAPDGWLTLVDLVWLRAGVVEIGTAPTGPDEPIVLAGAGAPTAGRFELDVDTVRFTPTHDGLASVNGRPLDADQAVELADDRDDVGPSILRLGRLEITHIHRHDRAALRIKDPESPRRTSFQGVPRFDFDPKWVLEATFEPAAPDTMMSIRLVTDHLEEHPVAGTVTFEHEGVRHSLRVEPAGGGFFLVFGDDTNGTRTYGGGRFLSVPAPDAEGRTRLDFNRATTPPCAFTPYATCPTPPPGNRLPFDIPAGERRPEPNE